MAAAILYFMSDNETGYYFDTALIPPQHIVCGVQLKPFCLGHYMILRQLHNPLISDVERAVTADEGVYWLFHAIITCALSYEDNLEMMQDDAKFKKICNEFSEHLIQNMADDAKWNIPAKLLLFKKYINNHFSMPMYEVEGKHEGKASGIDWCQNMFNIFKQHMGYTDTEILNMPFRKLFYLYCSYAEENGALKVFNKTTLRQYATAKGLIKA